MTIFRLFHVDTPCLKAGALRRHLVMYFDNIFDNILYEIICFEIYWKVIIKLWKKPLKQLIFQCLTGFLIWRRRRDLNSRAAYTTYTLSRGASSPLEYFSKPRVKTRSVKRYRRLEPLAKYSCTDIYTSSIVNGVYYITFNLHSQCMIYLWIVNYLWMKEALKIFIF